MLLLAEQDGPMLTLLAQAPDFDWTGLVWVVLAVLGGLGGMIKQWYEKKNETVDAEVEEDTPRPGRPPTAASRPAPPRPAVPLKPLPGQSRPAPAPRPLAQPRPGGNQPPARPAQPARPPIPRPAAPRPAQPVPPRTVIQSTPLRPLAPAPVPAAPVRALEEHIQRVASTVEDMAGRPQPAAGHLPATPAPILAGLVLSPENLRQVVILSEVLAPPLALRSPDDSPFAPRG